MVGACLLGPGCVERDGDVDGPGGFVERDGEVDGPGGFVERDGSSSLAALPLQSLAPPPVCPRAPAVNGLAGCSFVSGSHVKEDFSCFLLHRSHSVVERAS